MRCGSRRAVAERRRERENIHPPPNCMSRMGVPAAMGMEPDVCFLAPHRHASGHRLTGQWAIPFITWEKPVPRLAAAQRLEQLQRVGADADGAGLAPLTEEANVAALIQQLDVLPPQTAQLGHTAPEQIRPADHDVVPRCDGGAFYLRGTDAPEN